MHGQKLRRLAKPIAVTTYQELLKALVSATPMTMPQLQKRMQQLMGIIGGKHMRIAGYVLWKLIIDQGYDFVVRVGANVDLLSELCPYRREGKENCVLLAQVVDVSESSSTAIATGEMQSWQE